MAQADRSFVDVFLEQDPGLLGDYVRAMSPDDPLYSACASLTECVKLRNVMCEFDPTYERLCKTIDGGVDDIELYVLLLIEKTYFSLATNRRNETLQTINFLRKFDTALLRTGIVALLYIIEAKYYESLPDYESQCRAIDKSLTLDLHKSSFVYFCCRYERIIFLIRQLEVEETFRMIAELRSDTVAAGKDVCIEILDELYCLACVAFGKTEEALALFTEKENRVSVGQKARLLLEKVRCLLKLRRIDEADAALSEFQQFIGDQRIRNLKISFLNEGLVDSLLALRMIGLREIGAAREKLHRILSRIHRMTRSFPGMLKLLCEVELADAKTRAARVMLEMLDIEERDPSLHALWARLYWLEGRRERAARHFKYILDKNLPELTRDQLFSAYELTATDVLDLIEMAKNTEPLPSSSTPRPSQKLKAVAHRPEKTTFVGISPATGQIREQIARYAPLDRTVLITGATGTGKEIVAQLLHKASPRANAPFIAVNCGSFSDTLIQSELFGHVKGAFTGATQSHDGIFLAAGDGTIFLDEINAMTPRLQTALLRALETNEIRPVGSARVCAFRARVIAATNRPLDELVSSGEFRSDLFYRLAKLQIRIPPLADRTEDILPLVEHFLRRIFHQQEIEIENKLIENLQRNPWPGNVRELENEVERIVLLAGNSKILTADLFSPDATDGTDRPTSKTNDLAAIEIELPDPATGSPVPAEPAQSPLNYRGSRRQKLRELFDARGRLTRAEIIKIVGCAPNTATDDLRALMQEGYIRRINTSGHIRTSYFVKT